MQILYSYFRYVRGLFLGCALFVHCTENHIFFSRRPEKMVFLNKLCWNMIFLVLSGKMIFLFPENMILHLRRKMEDDLFYKIHGNMIFFSNLLKKILRGRSCAGTWSFLYYLERWYFIPENIIFFPWAESERRSFLGNTWNHDALPSR